LSADPADAELARITASERRTVELARHVPAVFNEHVLEDEGTGQRIQNAELHMEWFDWIQEFDRLIIMTSPESGKSQQITVGYSLWRIGRDPFGERVFIGSKTQPIARKFLGPMRAYVDSRTRASERYRQVFPNVKPGRPWADDGFNVNRLDSMAKDLSVEVAGACGNILGARFTLAILDDLIDQENTRTEYRADQVTAWITQTLEGRMLAGGKIILLCNAWEHYDSAHKLAEEHGWALKRSPIRDPVTKRTKWPERWPQERCDSYPPASAPRHLDLVTRAPGERRFGEAWIQSCMALGRGLTTVEQLPKMPEGCWTATAVDLATRKTKQSDLTVLFTALIGPASVFGIEGLNHDLPLIRPLRILAARMTSPEIKAAIIDTHARFGCRFIVEDNGAQIYIVQDLHLDRADIRVEPWGTTSAKWHPEFGVEGIATELSMQAWVIPSLMGERGVLECEPEVEAWIQEMRHYSRHAHTGDRLMASWILREGVRRVFSHEVSTMMTETEQRGMMPLERPRVGEIPPPPRPRPPTEKELAEAQAEQFWSGLEDLGFYPEHD
jgi:hypothetical protein